MANTRINLNGVRLTFMNIEGAINKTVGTRTKGRFNQNGARDFAIQLSEEQAEAMKRDGFNVKWPKPNPEIPEEEDTRLPTLSVTVSNNANIHPSVRVFVVQGTDPNDPGVVLDHSNYAQLDDMDILYADVNINVNDWNVNGNSGRKCYLNAMKVYIREIGFGESTY